MQHLTKNIVSVSLVIFVLAVVTVLGLAVFLQNKPSVPADNLTENNTGITSGDVALHNTVSDCWVIVSEKVYNVTDFISIHPGGSDKIISQCGKDATTAFETRGDKGPHPESAQTTLNNYYVGDLAR